MFLFDEIGWSFLGNLNQWLIFWVDNVVWGGCSLHVSRSKVRCFCGELIWIDPPMIQNHQHMNTNMWWKQDSPPTSVWGKQFGTWNLGFSRVSFANPEAWTRDGPFFWTKGGSRRSRIHNSSSTPSKAGIKEEKHLLDHNQVVWQMHKQPTKQITVYTVLEVWRCLIPKLSNILCCFPSLICLRTFTCVHLRPCTEQNSYSMHTVIC